MDRLLEKNKMLVFIVLNFLLTIGMNLGHAVTPALLKGLNLGPHVFGISFAAMSLTNFIFALIWSNLANGLKKTRILMISAIGYGFAQILFGFSTQEWTIYIARLLAGVFAGGFQVGLMSYIITEAEYEEQARYITISSVLISVGAAAGYYFGGLIGDISIPLTFISQMTLSVLVGLLFYFVLGRYEVMEEFIEKDIVKDSNPFTILNSSKKYWLGSAKYVFLMVLLGSVAVTIYDQSFNYYIKDIFDFGPSVNGNIKAIVGMFAVILNLFVIWRKRHKGGMSEEAILPLVIFVMAGIALFVAKIESSDLFLSVSLIWLGLNTVMIPLQQNLIMTFKTDNKSGNQLTGVYNALLMLGRVLGALVTSYVYSKSPSASFSVSGIILMLAVLAIVGHLLFTKTRKA